MILSYFKGIKPDLFRLSFCADSIRQPFLFSICPGYHKPFICLLRMFDGTRLYNIRLWSVLPYTAFYGFLRQYGNYWTIAAQAEKQTDGIFADLSGFSVHMGEYPFFLSDCLKRRNTAFSGILCRFAVCPIVSEYPFQAVRHCFRLSGCPVSARNATEILCQPTHLPTGILCKPLGSPGKFLDMVDLPWSVRIRQDFGRRLRHSLIMYAYA